MLEIAAVYQGPDGFRGFTRGKRYNLRVVKHEVIRIDGAGRITYNSLESFLRDWVILAGR